VPAQTRQLSSTARFSANPSTIATASMLRDAVGAAARGADRRQPVHLINRAGTSGDDKRLYDSLVRRRSGGTSRAGKAATKPAVTRFRAWRHVSFRASTVRTNVVGLPVSAVVELLRELATGPLRAILNRSFLAPEVLMAHRNIKIALTAVVLASASAS
jgi:hypothetical protein